MLRVRVRRGLRVNTLRPSPLTAVDAMEEPPASPLLVSIAAADISHIMRGDGYGALFGINEDTGSRTDADWRVEGETRSGHAKGPTG